MYLLDTNIFLELFLDQEKSNYIKKFFNTIDTTEISLTDFSLHSIGIILSRLRKRDVFNQFINDIILVGNIQILSIMPEEIEELSKISKRYNFDFDKTDKKRKSPEEIMR